MWVASVVELGLDRYSVTVDGSSFAVSLFLGDSISFTSILSARESIDQTCFCCVTAASATIRTDHRIRVCNFVYLFRAHRVFVACSRTMCSCVRSCHPRPSHCVGDPPVYPPMPRQDGIGDTVLCLCCVVVARAFDNLELWSLEHVC